MAKRRISGVKGIYIAKLLTSGETPTWEEVKELPQFIDFSYTPVYGELQWYSNDSVELNRNNITGYELAFTLGSIEPEIDALISGATIDKKGVLVSTTNDTQSEFAVIVVLAQDGEAGKGTLSHVFYRTTLAKDEVSGETVTDSVTDSPVAFSGVAMPLNGKLMSSIDSFADGADTETIKGWTKKVYWEAPSE